MSTQPNPPASLAFGPFEFEMSGELRKHGTRVRLQGQPLQILTLLLERPGATVSRDDLRRHLWPGAVSGDFEHGVTAAVNKLRQALGDSAEQPRYIETLPGLGYRWIAPLHTPPRTIVEIPRPEVVRAPVQSRKFPWLAIMGLVTLIATMTSAWLAARTKSDSAAPVSFTVTPPAGFFIEGAGNRQPFAIAHDGSRLAFTAMDDSGLFRVFVRDLQTLEPWEVPESVGANSVFWQPDSKALLYVSRGKLRRVRPPNDSTEVLADSIPGLLSGAWISPDRLMLATRLRNAIVSSSGGKLEHQQTLYTWPQLLPDGRNLLHVKFDPATGHYRGRIATFGQDGSVRDIVESDSKVIYAPPGHLLYVRAGVLLAHPFDARALRTTGGPVPVARSVCTFRPTASADFSVSETGVLVYQQCISRSQLMWVDREGQTIAPASPPDLALKGVRLSPDGRRLATSVYDVERGVTDVWLFDDQGADGRRTPGRGSTHSPVWSPDARRIVYARAYESTPKLFMRSLEAEEPEEALPGAEFQMPTDWSRDGRFILYNNTGQALTANEQHGDIWALDLTHGRSLTPLIRTPHHEANAVFSRDGKWLAFTSNDSGRTELYLQALEAGETLRVGGKRHLVSRHGAQVLRWRADGKELFYVGGDGVVYSVAMTLGPKPTIGPPSALFKISTAARAAIHALLGFDVSADGKRFVIPVISSPGEPSLTVVQNWHRILAARAQ
jgi:eukaryotic-like serine/threonine-protein kinase